MKRLRFKNDSTTNNKQQKKKIKKIKDVIEEQQQSLGNNNPQWLVAKSIDELLGKPIIISCNDFCLYSDDKNVYFKKTNNNNSAAAEDDDEVVVDDVNFVFSLIRLNSVYFLRNSHDLYFNCCNNSMKFDSMAMDQSCELELVVQEEEEDEGFSFRFKAGGGSSKEFLGLKKVSDELGVIDLSKESESKYSIKYLQYPTTTTTDGVKDGKISVESFLQKKEEEEDVDHYDELLKREKSKSDKHCK
jgi:hypothetical protein